ncbi:MAG: YodL domain-containing protein [Synergistaceae bacterium]|nr:YodL domain-containing protein [Proteiniphilum sp.]MDD3963157.1 YodL domain-containing protein [Synergistaceae bacterium]
MPRILIDAHNRILCYGNPAGYISGEKAIVDPMFQTAELESFLAKHSLEPMWQDGVYDRLVLGRQSGSGENAEPLKSCRIWQLRPDTPMEMRFIGLDRMEREYEGPRPRDYGLVYDGQVESNALEDIWNKFSRKNFESGGHPLAISDVVELYDDAGSEFYYCDRYDFEKINFSDPEQTQGMVMPM